MGDYKAENYTAAAGHLERAAKGLGDLADYAVYHRVKSLALADQHPQAVKAASDFSGRFGESRFGGAVRRIQAESLIRSEQTAEAKKFLDDSKGGLSEPSGSTCWPGSSTSKAAFYPPFAPTAAFITITRFQLKWTTLKLI